MVQWNEHGPRSQELPRCDFGSPVICCGARTESLNPSVLRHPKNTSPRHNLVLRMNALIPGWARMRSPCGTEGRKHPNKDCGGVRWL